VLEGLHDRRTARIGTNMTAEEQLRQRIGRNVRAERERQGLSQRELARQAGISQKHLSHVENAEVSVGADTIDALAKALGISSRKLTD
jgi:XRE family transcriptional regulator, aerobic/anaerobic benzoate catabolism transcriptional regulator